MEKTKTTQKLVECAILVAMAFLLTFIIIIKMPFGGSVTAASMLPVIIAGYRNGFKWGMLSGFVYSLLQLLMGAENLGYGTTPWAVIAILMLDYIVAFSVIGLIGLFKKNKKQTMVLVLGTLAICLLRFICHFITGCTVWAGVSIPTSDGMIYSLAYNAAYMIPETVITVYVAALISNAVDLRANRPVTRKKSENLGALLNGVLLFGISIVVDFIMIFQKIQSKDGFDITLISKTNWGELGIITLAGIAAGAIVYFISKKIIVKDK